MKSPVRPWLVIAIGNPSRGDDALGPCLMARLSAWLDEPEQADYQAQTELLEDFQLQIDYVLDLQDRARILLIDAAAQFSTVSTRTLARTPALHHYRALPDEHTGPLSHALSPEALLAVWQQINPTQAIPPLEVLAVLGEAFELGAPLSLQAETHCAQTWSYLQNWFKSPAA